MKKKKGHKKRCKHDQEDQSTSGMESLPPEIILDIFSRLPITSLVQCKFVCRACCNLALDLRLANMHFSRAAENDPCLVFHSVHSEMIAHPIQNQLSFVDINSHNSYQEKIKEFNIPFRSVMLEFDVVGSCNGFLCLSNSLFGNPHTVYIYTILSQESVKSYLKPPFRRISWWPLDLDSIL